jgi:hypothetical protein
MGVHSRFNLLTENFGGFSSSSWSSVITRLRSRCDEPSCIEIVACNGAGSSFVNIAPGNMFGDLWTVVAEMRSSGYVSLALRSGVSGALKCPGTSLLPKAF